MTIKVIGKSLTNYEVICTDKNCNNIIRFDSSDVRSVARTMMGRDAGSVQGISCPDCYQVLPVAEAIILGSVKKEQEE